jgi:hypothetical protein
VIPAGAICRGCHGPSAVLADEDIPLCGFHWNAWLARYLGADDQPSAAHLIHAGEAK